MISGGEPFFLTSVEILNNSGDQYYNVLLQMKNALEQAGATVCAIVGDNASGV